MPQQQTQIGDGATYYLDPSTGKVWRTYKGADGGDVREEAPAEQRGAALKAMGYDPTLDDAHVARQYRRQAYAEGGPDAGNVPGAEEQNTADVNADNVEAAAKKAAAEQQVLGQQRQTPGGPGAYVDNAGVYHSQGPTLQGVAGALTDAGSNLSQSLEFGGHTGGAADAVARAQGFASAADQRAKIQADYTLAGQSRGSQLDALGMYKAAAEGKGPSAAQGLLQQGVDRGIQAATSLGNSSRGGALALAQGRLGAQASAANSVAAASAAATQLRNQEQQQGMAGYAGLGSQIRGQDANEANSQAGFALSSQAQNDARNQAYENQAYNTNVSQMQGQQARLGGLNTSLGAAQSGASANAALQAANQQHSEDNTWRYIGTGAGIVGAGAAAALPLLLGGSANKGNATQTGETNTGAGAGDSVSGLGGAGVGGGIDASNDNVGTSSYAPGGSMHTLGQTKTISPATPAPPATPQAPVGTTILGAPKRKYFQ